jgi:TatD DNase family protein
MAMLIDSHCHLDAAEFAADRSSVITGSTLSGMIVPAVQVSNFETVRALAHSYPGVAYGLGIHPMYVQHAHDHDLVRLETALTENKDDPLLVAVGEIGLDFFVPEISVGPLREKQEHFYQAQLKLARKFGLPVILHVRRSQDVLLKHLRRIKVAGGIAHAFNGSQQQADAFVSLGFCLGFGGAMTYPRALQIRRLAQALSEQAIVLETDSPDIAPEWLHRDFLALPPELRRKNQGLLRNTPSQLPGIAECLAALRGISLSQVANFTSANVMRVLPRMARVLEQL